MIPGPCFTGGPSLDQVRSPKSMQSGGRSVAEDVAKILAPLERQLPLPPECTDPGTEREPPLSQARLGAEHALRATLPESRTALPRRTHGNTRSSNAPASCPRSLST